MSEETEIEETREEDPVFAALVRRVAEAPRAPARVNLEGRSVGPFVVEQLLGRGGMGEVWRATDTRLHRRVALKLLLKKSGARLLEEARAAAAVQSARVATIYEVGSADDVDFIALEFVSGENLRRRVRRGALPIDDVIAIARDCAEGLAAVHKRGFVHRDIKPDNLALDDSGRAKLLDFGIAALAGEDAGAIGTLRYMPPEQRGGAPVDARADVFSLGVTLIELALGRAPFDDDGKLKGDPLAELKKIAPVEFHALMSRALAADPRERPQDGAALLRELTPKRAQSDLPAKVAIVTTAFALAVGALSLVPRFEHTVVGDLPPALGSAPDVTKDVRVRARFRAAVDAILAGDGATAAAILPEVVRAEPSEAWPFALLAFSRAAGNKADAIARARKNLREEDGPALPALLALLEAQGLDGIAADDPSVATALRALRAPTNSLFEMTLLAVTIPGTAEEELGRIDAVISRDPEVALAWISRADAQPDPTAAKKSVKDGLSRVPGNSALEGALLRALIANDELDEAERRAKDLMRVRPDDVGARAALIEIARRRGNIDAVRAQSLMLLDGPFSMNAAGRVVAKVALAVNDAALVEKAVAALRDAGELRACEEAAHRAQLPSRCNPPE